MASIFKAASHPLFLILILFSASQFLVINCTEFEVGGRIGWVVPNSKDKDEMYNQWASQNRFKIDDTIRKYHFLPMKHEHSSFDRNTFDDIELCRFFKFLSLLTCLCQCSCFITSDYFNFYHVYVMFELRSYLFLKRNRDVYY
jgi:hypothetical protein